MLKASIPFLTLLATLSLVGAALRPSGPGGGPSRDSQSGRRSEPVSTAPADTAGLAEAEYEHLLETYAPVLVTIKFVQKTQGRFGDFEGENEINGVMIEPTGLVMCSNTMLGGSASRRGGGRSVPTDIKILVGEDTQGLDAKFMARDTELDLAWLQIKDPGERKFPSLDLPTAANRAIQPRLGARVLALGVMGRYFGQEVLVSEGVVAGRTHKPRELYVIRGGVDTDPGLPVFTPDGDLMGFATIQQPDPDEIAGNAANLTARGRGLILPVHTVERATNRAKEVQAEESKDEAPPASPAEPDEPGAPEE